MQRPEADIECSPPLLYHILLRQSLAVPEAQGSGSLAGYETLPPPTLGLQTRTAICCCYAQVYMGA